MPLVSKNTLSSRLNTPVCTGVPVRTRLPLVTVSKSIACFHQSMIFHGWRLVRIVDGEDHCIDAAGERRCSRRIMD